MNGQLLIVRGQVQGVGFRPTVWRLALQMGLTGSVCNSGDGVEIRVWGQDKEAFAKRLRDELPVLASIESLECKTLADPAPADFAISSSVAGGMVTSIAPDCATCADCLAEIQDPFANRYRYPFTNCTNCGPRFSIIDGAPYDRCKTTMREFELCSDCRAEFNCPDDRRFHAQPIACCHCGPRAWFEHLKGGAVNAEAFSMMDDVEAAGGALMNGFIVAIKGLGGVHLACDATKAESVNNLRTRKRRREKAFALMARDVDVIRRYALVSAEEEVLLTSPAAPIVLLQASGESLPEAVAPGLHRLGFMLPHTPMHHIMLRRMKRPVVMTSGNIAGQPQCISNAQTRDTLAEVATFALLHNRTIANRIDDSVVRVDLGIPRVIRRARGYAPQPRSLPPGFNRTLSLTAMGAEQKNTFCIVKDGQAIVSQHIGDLDHIDTYTEALRSLELFTALYDHKPDAYAVDSHPDYLSTKRGYDLAGGLPVVDVQHHHAHIAAVLAENDYPLDGAPVLGVVMDGTGAGDDGSVWGGEFLIADYRTYRREGCLKPVALPGGFAAVLEPWRNAYAHLMAELGWQDLAMNFADLALFKRLDSLPRETLDGMIHSGTNTPMASSCGRLFDAVAAMTGIAWDRQSYEGEAAMKFEAAIDTDALNEPDELIYPFSIPRLAQTGMPYIEPVSVWRAVLGDLILGTPVGTIAARFHRGLAGSIVSMAKNVSSQHELSTVALSGGCFQNATLFRLVHEGLDAANIRVLSHSSFPANDGGLSLGQATVALATLQQE